jgi:hypothetical protein
MFHLTIKYSPSSIFFISFVIIFVSLMVLPVIIAIVIIISIIVLVIINREKNYFHYSPFEIDSTEFIQTNKVTIGYFEGIQYWKIPSKNKVNEVKKVDIETKQNNIILFINGNAGNITYRQNIFQNILDGLDLPIYSLDYLSMKDKTIESIIDLHVKFIRYNIKDKNFQLSDIIIFGESIGNAIGLEVVQRMNINRFVFYGGFTKISDVIQYQSPMRIPFLNLIVTEFDNYKIIDKKIKNKNFKIIMLHATHDELIKFESIESMADKFNINLIELKGGHNDSIITESDFNFIKLNI